MTKETRLASLSTLGEFYLVILLCFGVQIILAVRAVVRHWKGGVPREVQVGNAGVLRLVTLELLCLWAALWIGSLRGWSLVTLGLHISWMGTFMGGLLFAALMVQATLFALALKAFGVNTLWTSIRPGTTLPFVLLVSIVNPVFEEAIGAGYVIHALQQFGMWPAVLASAFFATFLHAYQVLQTLALTFLTRITVCLAYWRWRQLWPLVVAHCLVDVYALLAARLDTRLGLSR